jgi:class I fructose-bisphosphate aldolase
MGLIVHLSASTALSPTSNTKTLVGTVEEAICLGADAVSVHINLGDENERDMLADFGRTATACDRWGMPLLAMVYARGPRIQNGFAPELVAHCARVGVELGADIVKVPYSGDPDSFSDVVAACCVPVVIAGGERMESTADFLQVVYGSLLAGGAGLSVGRNVFQHPRRADLVRAVRLLVHENGTVEQALALVGE